MIRSLFSGLVFMIAMCTLTAQNPGYQGKKLSMNYSFYTINALRFPNEAGNTGLLAFNAIHYANLDMAVSKKRSIGVSFQYLHTCFRYDNEYEIEYTSDWGGSEMTMQTHSHSLGRVESYNIGIYPRFFFRGNISPLGTYLKLELLGINYKVYPGNPVPEDKPNGYQPPKFSHDVSYWNIAFAFGIGQNRIFFNRMFLDYGLRFKIYPDMLSERDVTAYTNKDYLKKVPYARLASMELFNIKVGVGVLLF